MFGCLSLVVCFTLDFLLSVGLCTCCLWFALFVWVLVDWFAIGFWGDCCFVCLLAVCLRLFMFGFGLILPVVTFGVILLNLVWYLVLEFGGMIGWLLFVYL